MEPLELVVTDKRAVAMDIVRLELRRPDGGALPGEQPGAHIALDLEGRVRRYSLLHAKGDPNHYAIGVLRTAVSQGGSHFVHDQLAVGDRLRLLEVTNDFVLHPDAPHILLIGGGIGITPLLSMAERLQADGRSFALHQIVRDAARLWPLPPSLASSTHIGRSGIDLRSLLAEQAPGSHVYVCGPAGLVRATRAAASGLGWEAQRIHTESFGGTGEAQDMSLRVKLRQSGLTVDVAPGKSLLDALLTAGVWTGYECRRGVCGACLTEVVQGQPIHRDSLAPELRGRSMCTCVSWAEGPELELNL